MSFKNVGLKVMVGKGHINEYNRKWHTTREGADIDRKLYLPRWL